MAQAPGSDREPAGPAKRSLGIVATRVGVDAPHRHPPADWDFSGSARDGKELGRGLPAFLGKDRTFHTSAVFPQHCGLCVGLEMATSFYLRVSVCTPVHTCVHAPAHSCLRPSVSEQMKPRPIEERHFTLGSGRSDPNPCVLVLNPGRPVYTQPPPRGDALVDPLSIEQHHKDCLLSLLSLAQVQTWLWGTCHLWSSAICQQSALTGTRGQAERLCKVG